jgi:hypothetical protein
MPDRPLSRPERRSAGAALLISLLAHAGGFLVLWACSGQRSEAVRPLAVSELVVLVGDDGPRRGKDTIDEVTLASPDPPAPSGKHATLLDTASVAATDPERDQVPRVHVPPSPVVPPSPTAPPSPVRQSPGTADGSGGTSGAAMGSGPSFFQAAGTGRTVVYVLDHSMSMGLHDGLRQARAELLASLGRLPPTVQFQIVPYNQMAEPLPVRNHAGWLVPDADTLTEVARAVAELRATGLTDHVKALKRALEFRPDVLFLATDADDLNPSQVAAVSAYNRGRCSIHVIDFSNRPDDPASPLRQLAEQNRGTYRRVPVKEL